LARDKRDAAAANDTALIPSPGTPGAG
jgi:hypothetical protein